MTDMLAAYGYSVGCAGTRDPGSQERGTIPMHAGGELQKPSAQTILEEVPDSRSVCPVPGSIRLQQRVTRRRCVGR